MSYFALRSAMYSTTTTIALTSMNTAGKSSKNSTSTSVPGLNLARRGPMGTKDADHHAV